MKRKRTDWKRPTAQATAPPRPRTGDPWAGEDVVWPEKGLARRWLTEATPEPVDVSGPSVLRVAFVCGVLGALLWALAGYGLFRLIAG